MTDSPKAWPIYPGPRPAVCIHCGKTVRDNRKRYCNHCGEDFWSPDDLGVSGELVAPGEPSGPIIVWSYPGRTQADAADLFGKHAAELAEKGYSPVSQSWADGRPGVGRVLAIGLAANMVRPKGYLTVTYRRQEQPGSGGDPIEQIQRLAELRDAGLISADEFEGKRQELLSRI